MSNFSFIQVVDAGRVIQEGLNTSSIGEDALKVIDRIKNFLLFLDSNISRDNLDNMHYNIRNLKANIYFNHDDLDFTGLYDISTNELHIDFNYLDLAIYHELFHMASRDKIKRENAGFTKNNDIVKYYGINEGYTDLLAERYFEEEGFYEIEKDIAYLIEKVAGKDNMERCYFHADIDELIKILSNYSSESNTLMFLDDYDYVSFNADEDRDIIFNTKLYYVGKYLLESFYYKEKFGGFSYDRFIYDLSVFVALLRRYGIMNNSASKSVLFETLDSDTLDKCMRLSKKM